MSTPRSFFEKIWADHVIADLGDNTCLLQIDRLFLHEMSGSGALEKLEAAKRKPASPRQVYTVIDHVISVRPGRGANEPRNGVGETGARMISDTREKSREYGFTFFDVGDVRQGIVHVVSPEQAIALPGLSLVCGDSHTCTIGGVGALAWGIGTTECEHVLATQTLPQVKPKTMRVNFEGRPGPGVSAKDMVLHLIGTIGANGGIGYAVEFAGEAVRAMPVEGRLTLCNMAIEFSAKYGFVAPDETTYAYLKGRGFAPKGEAWERAVAYWRTLPSDPGARYDHEVNIDCAEIAPQVTWGTSPQSVVAVTGRVPDPAQAPDDAARTMAERALAYMQLTPGTAVDTVPIDVAYIGSCTNARLSDLEAAASVLRGRRVAPGVLAVCVPGSSAVKAAAEAAGLDAVFREAGFEWLEAGCAYCGGGGYDRLGGRRVISTTNRNFEGRQGPATRTHLASPATVAASAVAGHIADARAVAG